MAYYPIFINLENTPCLVVGGGKVAYRKIRTLLEHGAYVTVISPEIDVEIKNLLQIYPNKLRLIFEPYSSQKISMYQLVIAATDDKEINQRLWKDAAGKGVLINVVDSPELCTFQSAAVLKRGLLQIAVHTSGECPALAAKIKKELAEIYPQWFEHYTSALGKVRQELLRICPQSNIRKNILDTLSSKEIRENCAHLSPEEIEKYLLREMTHLLKSL